MTKAQQYSVFIKGCDYATDWGWPDNAQKKWMESERDGRQWCSVGSLSEPGRKALLKHFHLEALVLEFTLETLAQTSPEELIARRRALEEEFGLERAQISNELHGGERVFATSVAA